MSTAPKVLLIAPPGPGRRSTAKTLRALGYRVRTASEPYEGTARFVESAADLVLLSLADFGPRDTAFLHTVRRRSPQAKVVLLVPEGRREAARRALSEGADVCLAEPFHTEELTALVRALAAPPTTVLDLTGESGKAVKVLAREIAHGVNNPLQVLQLLCDEEEIPDRVADDLVEQIGRMSDVMRILEKFTKIGEARPTDGHLGATVRDALAVAEAQETIRLIPPPPGNGPVTSFDPGQIRYAVDCCVEFLAARSSESPLPVKAAVHRLTPRQGRVLGRSYRRAVHAGRFAEIAFKARGVRIEEADFRKLERRVLWNHAETRRAHPGLAPVAVVAALHGGRLVIRQAKGGTVLGIVVALP